MCSDPYKTKVFTNVYADPKVESEDLFKFKLNHGIATTKGF